MQSQPIKIYAHRSRAGGGSGKENKMKKNDVVVDSDGRRYSVKFIEHIPTRVRGGSGQYVIHLQPDEWNGWWHKVTLPTSDVSLVKGERPKYKVIS